MSYLVLARKYRPQKFSDLTGQETISKILKAAIQQNRVASAYLFSGPRGIGKTTSARIFAKALNCHKLGADAEPCNACDSCIEISKGSALDVMELDAASHTGVDKIREVIIDTVAFAPARDKRKIFIIDEVHMLSGSSFNALLKTLEEPPAHVVFILATTEFHKLPATVVSRCQRFRFLPLTIAEIAANLKKVAQAEKIAADDAAFTLLAKSAGGAMRDALSLFDQIISHAPADKKAAPITQAQVEDVLGVVREEFLLNFIQRVAAHDAKGVLEATQQMLRDGYDLSYFLKELRESFRDLLVLKCGYASAERLSRMDQRLPVDAFSKDRLLRCIQLLNKCWDQMRWNDLPHVVFESYAVRMCEEALDVAEILERLERLESGRPAPARFEPAAKPAPAEDRFSEPEPAAIRPSLEVEVHGAGGEILPISADMQQSWKRIMAQLHDTKPTLFGVLSGAEIQWQADRLEVTFAKPFGLDSAKRNSALIEELLKNELKKKISLVLKLGEPKVSPVIEEEDDDRADDPQIAAESVPGGESFEVVEENETKDLFSIEDEGAKKFMELFPGQVTKAAPQS